MDGVRVGVYVLVVFFFNDTATTEIYTLSLHDALPICWSAPGPTRSTAAAASPATSRPGSGPPSARPCGSRSRSEEHTSELQSRQYLVCRLLLEKKKNTLTNTLCFCLLRPHSTIIV